MEYSKVSKNSKKFVAMHDDGTLEEFAPCTRKAIVFHVLNPKKQWMENHIGYVGPCRIGDTPIFIKDDKGETHIVYGIECFWQPFREDRMELTEEEKKYWTEEKRKNIEAGKKLEAFYELMRKSETLEEFREALKLLED